MKTSTIAIILNNEKDAFLMGYHQRGEGKGKLNFIGGKVANKCGNRIRYGFPIFWRVKMMFKK